MVIASRWNSCHPFSGELQTNAYADVGFKVGTVVNVIAFHLISVNNSAKKNLDFVPVDVKQ